jgi:MFS family permease
MSADAPVFCVNHPKTETLLRCNKCGKPVCLKCVERTPVGYRCKECLNVQRAGYYTATLADYALTAIIGAIASIIAGGIAVMLLNLWLIMIFYAPAAGGIIAELVRRVIQKRRGKYIPLLGCAIFVVGGLVGAGALPLLWSGLARQFDHFWLAFSVFFQLGLWIFIVLGASTVAARLRS